MTLVFDGLNYLDCRNYEKSIETGVKKRFYMKLWRIQK
jgi:hypothetical protein